MFLCAHSELTFQFSVLLSFCFGRLRMGLGFFFGALGALIGAPINGTLLGDHDVWSKTLIFSGVSTTYYLRLLPLADKSLPFARSPSWQGRFPS